MSEVQYIEPNLRARNFKWFTLILYVGLALLLEPGVDYLLPSQDSPLIEQEASLIFIFKLEIGVYLIMFPLLTIWAIYCGYLGYSTIRLKSFPPSGLIIVSRTRKRTGKQTVKAGYIYIGYALLISLNLLFMGYIFSTLCSGLLDLEKNKIEVLSPNVVSSSEAIKWVIFTKESSDSLHDDFTPYIAPEIIRISDNKVQMWTLTDYDVVQKSIGVDFSYLSFKMLMEYDCKEEESRFLYYSYHSKNMGKGEIVNSRNRSSSWLTVRPNGSLRAKWNYACGK